MRAASEADTEPARAPARTVLDTIERIGNSIPHPVVIFLILIAITMALSHLLHLLDASVSYQVINLKTHGIDTVTARANSLLTAEGIRHVYTQLVPNFMGFSAAGLLIVAMMGVGVAEAAGLVDACIRKLVTISPDWALTYILAFVGILSSVAADAGYLVLIPLAGSAFLSVGRHPLAGIALGMAGVASAFSVNMLVKPLDAVLTELTNDAIHIVNPAMSIAVTANLWFSIVSVIVLTVVIAVITTRILEPRLGTYREAHASESLPPHRGGRLSADEARGLRYAGAALLALALIFCLLTLPPGAPLRNPTTGALVGDSPFMSGMIGLIMLLFLVTGIAYGIGAGTIRRTTDVVDAMTKAVSGLGGTILLFVVISQFVDYFTYSNMPTLLAVKTADVLKNANIGPLWLLLGLILIVAVLDLVFTPAIATWAIFAPVFVPLFVQLSVDPAAVLAAYRVGDGPINSITPLNPYFALIVGLARKYERDAGVGTVVALMLPYVAWMLAVWVLLFAAWYLSGLPWGV
ncbi:AbgT family transporter [Bradyrhizobium sp. BWA-3-5]|jgi:aminobenzoyl-glutamate transport protein|uniref:AbgT family transporter n=1 Tax=Bradyrhizobium sp. BWA-3-5 TaxID=3080013 RepID=UPI00293E3079|nr:AbgT family transporter [Bradyrhizobium sp. BWA-3-5]WOH64454.1 AbgT family transporter [Bradyrhizobium sp. BWA-3-5]